MTEYELISLLQTQINTIGVEIMDYFTVLTAFLVAGYVAAHRLTLSMSLFVTVMFVVSALFFVASVMGDYEVTKVMMGELRRLADTGTSFRWVHRAQQSPLAVDIISDVALFMMLCGILGGVYFFFQSRRHNRAAAVA
jgi:hypothetical protein